jgi:vacuolar-type H+-ATPase subunit D/Vma8
MIAPNKQNLLIQKNQKKLVANGYKLLKEKRAGLIVTFLEFATKGKKLEKQVSTQITSILNAYRSGLAFVSSQALFESLKSKPSLNLSISKKRVSGVYVDSLNLQTKIPKREELKFDIATSLESFGHFFPLLLELSQLKINTLRIAAEIDKTNRQIQNLERKIEDIEAEIKFIENALNEKSNLEKATLIKIFK